MSGITKLTVNVPTKSLERLRHYATSHRVTMTESIRQAVGLQSFLSKEVAKGGKVLIEDRRGGLRQLIDI